MTVTTPAQRLHCGPSRLGHPYTFSYTARCVQRLQGLRLRGLLGRTSDIREVSMRYVLLGTLGPEWVLKQTERTNKARSKLEKLGIKLVSIYYTQGYYDFVDIVDAPNPEALLSFSVWYAAQGMGRIHSMPAFAPDKFEAAVKAAK
jgi:uncharacterized protein with GYD domain